MLEHGRSGFMVPSGDARALADELLAVYRLGSDGRREIGAAARSRVERHFTMDRIADRYLELYRALVRSGSGPASQ
jgi:glycosyltransferase involved in cell wall biosynthesis